MPPPTTDVPQPLDYATRRAERDRRFWAGAVCAAAAFFVVAVAAIIWVRIQAAREAELRAVLAARQAAAQAQMQNQAAAALQAALARKQVQLPTPQLSSSAQGGATATVLRLPRIDARRTDKGLEVRLRNDHRAGDVRLDGDADRVIVEHGPERHVLSAARFLPPGESALAPGATGPPVTLDLLPGNGGDLRVIFQHADPAGGPRVETAAEVQGE